MANNNQDDDVDNAVEAFVRLGINHDDAARVLAPVRQRIQLDGQRIRLLRGQSFCTIQEVLQGAWQPFAANHYAETVRNWNNFRSRVTNINPNAEVVDIYRRTRDAANNQNLEASDSRNISSVTGVSPVRLCAFPTAANFVDRAHLCPKTSVNRKTDTWLYVAAAVLGMDSDTEDDRAKLVKALCGSCKPGGDAEQWTGVNRSPFNLLLFANQRTWYDLNPGVLVLPIKNLREARDWDGGSYEVLILWMASVIKRLLQKLQRAFFLRVLTKP